MIAVEADRLRERFGLTYHIDCLERAASAGHLSGLRVLEIGGALPRDLVIDHYRAASWTAVDDVSAYSAVTGISAASHRKLDSTSEPASDGDYCAYDGDVHRLPPSFRGAFNAILSIATFEHIADLESALARMASALKADGVLLAQVGPIWSGWRGYHIYPDYFNQYAEQTRDLLDRLVPWQHLMMDAADMMRWLRTRYSEPFSKIVVDSIYHSPRLNRLFVSEYQRLFTNRNLWRSCELQPNGVAVPMGWERALQPMLERYYESSRFDVDCFWVKLYRAS